MEQGVPTLQKAHIPTTHAHPQHWSSHSKIEYQVYPLRPVHVEEDEEKRQSPSLFSPLVLHSYVSAPGYFYSFAGGPTLNHNTVMSLLLAIMPSRGLPSMLRSGGAKGGSRAGPLLFPQLGMINEWPEQVTCGDML